jgi:hypothetical protein
MPLDDNGFSVEAEESFREMQICNCCARAQPAPTPSLPLPFPCSSSCPRSCLRPTEDEEEDVGG